MVSSTNQADHITDGTNTRHFTWTANGNMATDDRTFVGGGAAAFTYGGRDKLESMTVNSQGITYKVNAFNQRVSMAFSGATTHYIHNLSGHIIAEANGSTGTTTMEYVWMEGELLAQIDGSGNIVYVHNNQIGAPQKITNPSRTLVWDQIIEPFGEVSSTPTNTTPTAFRFPGQYADANNSLSYNWNRYYDSSLGFYPQHDHIGFKGGLNLYRYSYDNPTQWVDPTGEQTWKAVALGGLICLGVWEQYVHDTHTNGKDEDPTEPEYHPYDLPQSVPSPNCPANTSCPVSSSSNTGAAVNGALPHSEPPAAPPPAPEVHEPPESGEEGDEENKAD